MTDHPESLTKFEWHDLPVTCLCISDRSVELLVTPFDEDRDGYDYARLTLSGYERLALSMAGRMTLADQRDLEVFSFEHDEGRDGLLSGRIGILAGSAGLWTIEFERAAWECRLSSKPLPPTGKW